MNLAKIVESSAQSYPDRLALQFEDQRLTYAQLDQASSRAANGLGRVGLQRGDRATIWLPNSAAFIVAYLGIQKAGAVAVTVNTAFKAEEIQYILADSGARLLITTAALYAGLAAAGEAALAGVEWVLLIDGEQEGVLSLAALLEPSTAVCSCAEMAPDDPAILLYTSGTTGFPKGAILSHGAAVTAIQMVVEALSLCVEDRVLLPLSLFHSFGQTAACLPTLAAGATLLLQPQFEPQPVLAAIEEQAVTVFFGVPTVYLVLLSQAVPAQLRSVRRWVSAGAALPLAVASQWQACFGLPIQEGYGLTETFLATFNPEPSAKPGSVGRPLTGVRVQILDATGEAVPAGQLGEVVVETPSCMLGYWQRPDESAAVLRGGSFHTGDVGRLDEDGYLYIVDRIKDMVNVGGVKVYPSEVEQLLHQHPAVAEAAVFGVSEPVLGEQVQASVVLKPGAAVDAQELILFCGQRLAEFKVPSRIHIVDHLPKNRTGKLLRRLLRDQSMQDGNGRPAEGALQTALPAAVVQKADGEEVDAAALTRWMANWLADHLQVAVGEIGMEQPFAEMGLTSVMAVNLAHALGARLGYSLQAILLWNFPTIAAVVRHLLAEGRAVGAVSGQASSTHRPLSLHPGDADSVALIGIGCRLPGGADTPEKFWQLLRAKVDTVAEIPTSRWDVDAYYDPMPQVAGKMYVRSGNFLEEVDRFDAQFFGIAPLEAASMDPQQRLLLEVSWEALEHANLLADSLRESRTGVYVGAFWDDYSTERLYNAAPDQIDSYRMLSHLRGMTAGRLAYVLGLHGPAMQVDTACSSSLLAVHLACQSLRVGECDLALAGGVNLLLGPEQLVGLCQMGAVSADGRCKTFAAGADGFGVGEGAGMVVLKR
ncbi:MAG: AMP-binding protein, partial [Caldilinea sp.]